MLAPVLRRGFVAVMNAMPAPAAALFGTSTRFARITRPLVNALVPPISAAVVVRSGPARGTRLRIHTHNEKFYWTGLHEVAVQEAFVRLLRPGDTVWDVGAHIGFFSALAARCVGQSGRVHAFEPLRANRVRLLETIEQNGLDRVEVHPSAVAGRAGTKELYGHPASAMWSLVGRSGVHERVEVQCVTLDDLFADGALGVPALVKLDVEGAELEILRGAGRLLNETDAMLLVEFTDDQLVDEARSLLPRHTFEALSDTHWLLRRAP
jgi:FkbM family methyltransferase